MVGLRRTLSGNDAKWVIVDRLTKSAYVLPIRLGLLFQGWENYILTDSAIAWYSCEYRVRPGIRYLYLTSQRVYRRL